MEPKTSDGRLDSNQKSPPEPLQVVTLQAGKRAKAYQEPVKRVRAKNPKSRTGCGTCKIRRVKCDEQKPTCLRCQKAGMICNGYAKPGPTTVGPRAILSATTRPCHRAIIPISDRFQSADEYQYILHFREQSVFDLAGSMPTRLWNTVLLRASNDELALRSLAMAIAAICKAQDAVDGTLHHQFALRQYGKALHEIQTVISTRQDTDAVRISLIASLLIFCFQNLNGDREQAVEHAKMALGLMHQRFHTQNQRYSHLRRESSISELDDEIVEVFIRLDLTLWSHGGEKTQKSKLEIGFDDDQIKMPTTFQDVSEGQRYLRSLQHHAMPYLAKMTDVFMYRKSFTSDVPRAEYEEFSSKMQEWTWAFAPVLARALKGDGDETFIAAATLRSFALSNYLCVQRVCLGSGGESLNLFEREGQEILDLTRRIVNDRRFKKTFVFDCGVVPALFITFMICRKRSIREEAIRNLNLATGRLEMTWDARTVAAVCEKMLKAEDEERERERKELGNSAPPSSLLSERHAVSTC